jgi:hypothetical protein
MENCKAIFEKWRKNKWINRWKPALLVGKSRWCYTRSNRQRRQLWNGEIPWLSRTRNRKHFEMLFQYALHEMLSHFRLHEIKSWGVLPMNKRSQKGHTKYSTVDTVVLLLDINIIVLSRPKHLDCNSEQKMCIKSMIYASAVEILSWTLHGPTVPKREH